MTLRWRSAVAGLSVAMFAAGCGGGSANQARELAQRSILEDPPPLKESLVSQTEIDRRSPGSADRAFLSLDGEWL